ncbi:MAG: iron-sulfur cluster assembly scaffold protein, partial [Nitrososphaerota archaeon]
TNELGGLPSIKYHCSILAVGGLKRAIRKYFEEVRRERPEWLPENLSKEERQALEEEELIEKIYRKYGVAP